MAVVDSAERARANKARLNALEDDAHDMSDIDEEDEEFVLDSDEDSDGSADSSDKPKKRKKKKKPAKRKKGSKVARTSRHRGTISGSQKLKSLQDWIDQDGLEEYPEYEATYLTAVAGPARTRSSRTFCRVCGQVSKYCCVRCGTKYCCMRCGTIHNETRCLRFVN